MAFYMNMMALNEGEQAEEHLKKKLDAKTLSAEEKDRRKERYNRRYSDTSAYNDPKYEKGRALKEKRNKYGSVMPKDDTPSEKEYNAALDKQSKKNSYASRVANNYDNGYYKYDKESQAYIDAKGAARRHWDKEYKKGNVLEQGIFSECYFLDEE